MANPSNPNQTRYNLDIRAVSQYLQKKRTELKLPYQSIIEASIEIAGKYPDELAERAKTIKSRAAAVNRHFLKVAREKRHKA